MAHGDERDVRTPDLVRAVDGHALQQVGIDGMRRMRLAGSGPRVDRLQPQDPHQPPDAMATNRDPVPAQIRRDLAAAEERIPGERLVDRRHYGQRLVVDSNRCVVESRPAQLHQFALMVDAQIGVITVDHHFLLGGAHRLSP